MGKLVPVCGYSLCFFLLALISQITNSFSGSVVEFLPGFEGRLPFHLETGYIGVGKGEDVQLFYYFVKSESNPGKDPLLLWLTGGPGCSALSGLIYQIGPLNIKVAKYNGSLPTFVLREYSWTKISNIIFLDSPVGTGFSYARTPAASWSRDTIHAQHLHEFLRKWLIGRPEFLANAVYVGGDSYAGILVPAVVQEILNGNGGIKPVINVQGYIVGNPVTAPDLEYNSEIPFAHGMGLISDELYESLTRNCGGEYQHIDSHNTACLEDMQAYTECVSGINKPHILEIACDLVSPKPRETHGRERFLYKDSNEIDPDLPIPDVHCRTYSYLLAHYWANDDGVRKALHIRKGSIGIWRRCNSGHLNYTKDINESFDYHVNLSAKGVPSLVYSGDHDMGIPFLGTQAWIRNLNYSLVDDWRPWIVEGQVGGYTESYSNKMTFATVKGGGHTAPEYRPKECFFMFQRWISRRNI